jgi:hypothetical protein
MLLLEVVVMLLVNYGIDRYYLHSFGKVKGSPESRRLELLVQIVAAIFGLVAFFLDANFNLPFSLIGLVFAITLLGDYIRITWLVKGKHLLYYPVGAVLIIIVSLLPLFGLPGWWHSVGIRAQLFAVPVVIGIIMAFAGVWGHFYLVRTLSPKAEEQ